MSSYRVSRSTATKMDAVPASAKTWDVDFTSERSSDRVRKEGGKGR